MSACTGLSPCTGMSACTGLGARTGPGACTERHPAAPHDGLAGEGRKRMRKAGSA